MNFDNIRWPEIIKATNDTLIMLGVTMLFTVVIGFIIGIILFLTSSGQMLQNRVINGILSFIVNILRSVPFVILMLLVMPLTKMIVGQSWGVKGAIPPLIVAAAPFFARLVESALREVDRGVIEAAQAMGASRSRIVWSVLLRESRGGLIAAMTITAVTLISYTAMAGVIGAGGLGDMAIRYGYQSYKLELMLVTVAILVIMVQILQMIGDALVRRFSRK